MFHFIPTLIGQFNNIKIHKIMVNTYNSYNN